MVAHEVLLLKPIRISIEPQGVLTHWQQSKVGVIIGLLLGSLMVVGGIFLQEHRTTEVTTMCAGDDPQVCYNVPKVDIEPYRTEQIRGE